MLRATEIWRSACRLAYGFLLVMGCLLPAQTLVLEAQLQTPGTFHTDVWGYVDANTGITYAIVGDQSNGGSITLVDVSIADNPIQVANLNTVPGFDMKVWQHYVYTVNGGSNGQGGIVDISDPANPQVVGHFPSAHNIFISDNGYLVLVGSNAFDIYDLNASPTAPVRVWQGSPGGHDAAVIRNRLYDFHSGAGTFLYDFSIPDNPQLLGAITDPAIQFHHSGWVTDDDRYLFICDELARHPTPDITVWDISNPANPVRVGAYSDSNATVHNLYVIGQYAYVAYYTAGFRIFDISDPANLRIAAEFDTTPISGEGFAGAFGVYPFLPSGKVLVNDWDGGLFVFTFSELNPSGIDPLPGRPDEFILAQNYPNPFNPSTTIRYRLPKSSAVQLRVFNALGQPVRTLVNQVQSAGEKSVQWDGNDAQGLPVASGMYFYQLVAGSFSDTRRMILLH